MTSANTVVILASLAAAALTVGALVAALTAPKAGRYRLRHIMTPNEIEFFGRIRRALPEMYVFPQVAMSALLEPISGSKKTRLRSFRMISQKRVDYAVCDSTMRLLAVIELDDRTHNAIKDAARDAMFQSAGIPTLRFESKAKPSEPEILAAFMKSQTPRNGTNEH